MRRTALLILGMSMWFLRTAGRYAAPCRLYTTGPPSVTTAKKAEILAQRSSAKCRPRVERRFHTCYYPRRFNDVVISEEDMMPFAADSSKAADAASTNCPIVVDIGKKLRKQIKQ